MSADPDRALLATSLAFADAAVLGSVAAIRENLPGQPCGISAPQSVPAGLLACWGAGVAAPWPMPAAAVIAAAGIGCVLGHRYRTRHPPTALVVAGDQARDRRQRRDVGALTVTG